ADQIHKALWASPDHELVIWVRKQVVEEYPEIATDIGAGNLLRGDKLGSVLRDLGKEGARIVASVLWATRFEGPQAENLFRSLVPLAKNGFSRRSGEARRQDDKQAKELGTEIRRIGRELK